MRTRPASLALLYALPILGAGDASAVLERARRALGPPPPAGTVLEGSGHAHSSGAEGRLRVLLGPDGLFRSEIHSPLPEWSGFDGRVSWTRDRTGLERAVALEEADRPRLFHAVLSGQWIDARALEVHPAPDDAHPGDELRLVLAGTPLEMTLTLDATTALAVSLVEQGDAGERRWTFADHREVAGRRLPHAWTVADGVNEDRFRIEAFRARPRAEVAFEPELAAPRDVRFEPGIAGELTLTRASSGHLLVEPLLEGESFGPFVFDTGAGITVIHRRVADELLLETLGSTLAVGVVGSTTSDYRRGERFQLGPVVIENPVYGDLDLSFASGSGGRSVAGIVGYDLLARCVVELEPGTPRIVLHDPARFELAGGTWQPLVLHSNHPCVRARYEGEREGLFRLDSGASGTLTFHAHAVDARGLLAGRELRPDRSGGVGGTAAALEGELAWFELGGRRFEKPRVSFSRATEGAFTDRYTEGNIGLDFLSGFRIVLDYGRARVALVPLAR